jgi:GGDEF domain-containing protein
VSKHWLARAVARAQDRILTEVGSAEAAMTERATADINARYRRQRDADRQGLERMAFYDPLTGLGNRNLFRDRLSHALDVAKPNNYELGVLLIDLDRFKAINDTLGHHAGNETLREVARQLRRSLRKADTAARLGGDEFAVVLETGVSFNGARAAA